MTLNLLETKGDIKFYSNEKGILYQKIDNDKPIKVKNGDMTYKRISNVNGYTIVYNLNGIHGFAIKKGKNILEDNLWSLKQAEEIAINM